jgi:hypothetical protein
MKKYIALHVFTDNALTKKDYAANILKIIYNDFPDLAPEYANFYEPINKPVPTVEDALKYWADGFIFNLMSRRRTSPKTIFNVGCDKDDIYSIYLKCTWKKTIDWVKLFKLFQKCIDGYFGYVHLYSPEEIKQKANCREIYGDFLYTPGFKIRDKGIPDLAWGTFFGERYLDRLPLKELKKEGFTLKKQGQGYFLTLTDDISTLLKDYDGFEERRLIAKSLFPTGVFQERVMNEDEI